MTREDGLLESVTLNGTEMRLHYFKRGVVKRIPWHKDNEGGWYSGIEGPEIKIDAIRGLLNSLLPYAP